jgi:hypothetical protein
MLDVDFPDLALANQSTHFIAGTDALERAHTDSGKPVTGRPIDEAYLLGRRIPIKIVRELASSMLDSLESSYVLYQREGREALVPGIASASVAEIWSLRWSRDVARVLHE